MLTSLPDYPHIVLSFIYRGWKLEIDQNELEGEVMYAVWANDARSSVVAVPYAPTRAIAVKRAKQWADRRAVL